MNRDEARQLTVQIRSAVADVAELAQRAYDEQAWRVLDYPTWEDYCTTEFDPRITLTPTVRREAVQKMTEHGMSTRAQAPVLGVSASTVRRDQHIGPQRRNQPARIRSRDGRTYPAQRRQPIPRHADPAAGQD